MADPRRVVAVTLALVGIGVVVGAACGVAALTIVGLFSGAPVFSDVGAVGIAAAFGAMVGAVAAPLFSWMLLRHVPLGKAILHTAMGTILGGMLGLSLPVASLGGTVVPGLLYAPVAGFLLAAIRLRLTTPKSRPAELPPGQ